MHRTTPDPSPDHHQTITGPSPDHHRATVKNKLQQLQQPLAKNLVIYLLEQISSLRYRIFHAQKKNNHRTNHDGADITQNDHRLSVFHHPLSRHCGLASPNTYPTSLHASRSMICRFVTTIRLLPPVCVTDIVRFRLCRVPISWQLDPWRPTKHARHHYPPVRCLWCCMKG